MQLCKEQYMYSAGQRLYKLTLKCEQISACRISPYRHNMCVRLWNAKRCNELATEFPNYLASSYAFLSSCMALYRNCIITWWHSFNICFIIFYVFQLWKAITLHSSLISLAPYNEMREQVKAFQESVRFNTDESHVTEAPGSLVALKLPSLFSLLPYILLLLTSGVLLLFTPFRPRARVFPVLTSILVV